MELLKIYDNKTLSLKNVLSTVFSYDGNITAGYELAISKMQTYIRTHGANPIGPIIQHTTRRDGEESQPAFQIELMIQCDKPIHEIDFPFNFDTQVKINNCLYTRFNDDNSKIKYAYDKIGVYSYENDISLVGEAYTVFVDQNSNDGTIIADIFMTKC